MACDMIHSLPQRKKKKIGFFGGTFDPIHFGHLNLAIQMLEKHQFDEILFCPAALSPYKRAESPKASGEHRLEMVALAIAPVKSFTLLDWEIKREGPSFTIDTIRALIERLPDAEFHLLLGEDAEEGLALWKESDALLRLAPPFLATRFSHSAEARPELTPIPLLEISSTDIRERLRVKKYCGHLVPAKVLDYITQHRLYSSAHESETAS